MENEASLPETAQYVYQVFILFLELRKAKVITPKVYHNLLPHPPLLYYVPDPDPCLEWEDNPPPH